MEIQLEHQPLIVSITELPELLATFDKTMNLPGSIDRTTMLERNHTKHERKDVINWIYHFIDWKTILRKARRQFKKTNDVQEKLIIKFHKTKTYEKPIIKPYKTNKVNTKFKFDVEMKNQKDLFPIQNYVSDIDHQIDAYLKSRAYKYNPEENQWRII